ncbi:MAG TPA: DUF1801 domain-containing protein [Candidatus Acidoferrum sp.]|nr:DUF1801 domain-containing protein [Candidatus Acidoferrum sp.]
MAEKTATKKSTQKSAKSPNGKGTKVFSAEERAAIQARAREQRPREGKADGESDLLESIAKMQPPDRAMAKQLHSIIKASAAGLTSTTWYGMPAYAKDGKTICFFQPAQKFKTRYATLGFSDRAKLDEGNMWPNAYALTKLTETEEAKIRELLKTAVG